VETLTVVGDELEAETLCGLLRVNGIDCSYRRTDVAAGRADGSSSMSGPTEILVSDADLEAARELLPKS
jgi:hypothetical protein